MSTAVLDIDFFESLGTLPIPCIDDMTEEELDAMIDKALDDVKNGRTYTLEEAKKMLEEEFGRFEDLDKPSIPCTDDMTEEELDTIFLEGIREIEADNGIPSAVVERELCERYGHEILTSCSRK